MKTIEELEKENLRLNKKIAILTQAISQLRTIKQKFNESTKLLRKKDKELKELNKNLEEKVQEEIKKNRHQELRLLEQSKLAAMGEMIGNIAHQWRQPLNTITASTANIRIKKATGKLNDDILDKSLSGIENSVYFLSDTIDIFRDFIKEKKELKEVILQERINKSLNIIKASLDSGHIKLIADIDYSTPIKLNLAVGELSQILINIINNAKDALLEKKVENAWVKLDLTKEEDRAIITIEDNGGGIPDDVMPKIFDPYFTTKHKSQGTGLGLHMSYIIVKNSLKGELYAKNTKNGAKFFIELPLNN